MNYSEALAYIQSLSDIERSRDVTQAPPRFNLERVHRLLALAGRPQDRFKSIHITGTKGKGSTAAMIDAVLRASGYSVGLFTSPHLHSFLERISVNGHPISESELAAIASELAPLVELGEQQHPDLGRLTTFEVTTAIAARYFAERRIDFGILEVGLGGRLDATNVVTPEVAIITSISIDHNRFLGDTPLAIATEKAGVIKPGIPLVSAPQRPEVIALIRAACQQREARLIEVGRDVRWATSGVGPDRAISVAGRLGTYRGLRLALRGEHQEVNAVVAVAALEVLRELGAQVDESALCEGLSSVWWPGRLETVGLKPRVVVDGAHNVDSMVKLGSALQTCLPHRRLILVLGTSLDKDIPGMTEAIAPLASTVIATKSSHPRSAETKMLAAEAKKYVDDVYETDSVGAALRLAIDQAGEDDLVCATGSLFVVAEAREAMGLRSISDRFRE